MLLFSFFVGFVFGGLAFVSVWLVGFLRGSVRNFFGVVSYSFREE